MISHIILLVFKKTSMKKILKFLKPFIVVFLCLGIVGCVSIPKGFLKPSEGYLEKRQLQMRQYDTTNEEQIIAAVAGVLQDLGFTLDESETKLGLVCASKRADATSSGQITAAVFFDILFGSNTLAGCDKHQVVKASVVTKPALDGRKIVIRVTFQRIVWNRSNQISKVETITELGIYQKFYNSLSKAVFLEAQKI